MQMDTLANWKITHAVRLRLSHFIFKKGSNYMESWASV